MKYYESISDSCSEDNLQELKTTPVIQYSIVQSVVVVAIVALVSVVGVTTYVHRSSSLSISSLPMASIEVNKNVDTPLRVAASTTQFDLPNGSSACGCRFDKVKPVLTSYHDNGGEKWVGVATPAWMMGEYIGYKNGQGSGPQDSNNNCDCTIPTKSNPYPERACPFSTNNPGTYSNCGSGKNGGCGSCWKLTPEENPSLVVYGIVMDNCGLDDNGGNNEWCVPYTGIPDNGCPSDYFRSQRDKCARDPYPVVSECHGKLANPGDWTRSTTQTTKDKAKNHGVFSWSHEDCGVGTKNPGVNGDYDNFKCTNAAGYKMHFDMTIDNGRMPWDWPTGNPVVTAELIECPADLMKNIRDAGACKGNNEYNFCDEKVWHP